MLKGTKRSLESRIKHSETKKRLGQKPPSRPGIPNTKEQKEKIRATWLEKIRLNNGINPNTKVMYGDSNPSKSPEVRKKIGDFHRGKSLSEEHKKKLKENHRGMTGMRHSDEARAKMRRANTNKELTLRIRHLVESSSWRLSIFERDNFTCQMPGCGKRGGKLEANHIILFSKIISNNKIESIEDALRCKELWDISNGITLCRDCHLSIRRKEQSYEKLFVDIIKLNI